MTRTLVAAAVASLLAAGTSASAAPVTHQCAMSSMITWSLVPADLVLPGPPADGVSATVTIDPDTGAVTVDGASIVTVPFVFPFSQARDIWNFADSIVTGTIDQSGNVNLPGVRYTICTSGTPEGTDCVPGNVCSNDVTRPCVIGVPCEGGGTCRGLCRGDQTTTCDADDQCPAGGCSKEARLVPFDAAFTTGVTALGTLASRGSALDFSTGVMRLAVIGTTPPESPIIQDTGISATFIQCTLSSPPAATSLPPARWKPKGSAAALGKSGPGQNDDTLILQGTVDPIGTLDPVTQALVATIALPDDRQDRPAGFLAKVVTQITVPAGTLKGKGKTFKLKDKNGVVKVDPAPPGESNPIHTISIKKAKKGAYLLKLVTKGLDLDILEGSTVLSTLAVGTESGTATSAAGSRDKKRKVKF